MLNGRVIVVHCLMIAVCMRNFSMYKLDPTRMSAFADSDISSYISSVCVDLIFLYVCVCVCVCVFVICVFFIWVILVYYRFYYFTTIILYHMHDVM